MLAPSYIHRPNSSRDDAKLFHFAQREPPWATGYAVVFNTEGWVAAVVWLCPSAVQKASAGRVRLVTLPSLQLNGTPVDEKPLEAAGRSVGDQCGIFTG